MMAGILAGMLLKLLLIVSGATNPPPAVCPVQGSLGHCVFFTFDWPEAKIPRYTVVVQEDRVAHYWEGDAVYDETQRSKPALSVTPDTMKKIFDAETDASGTCETHEKHIAQTGKKTIAFYTGDETSGCSFNYSDKVRLNDLAALFQKMAETVQVGERLKHKHRFDRLGLDAELDSLVVEAKDGRAIELQNIAPVLQSIVDDDELMSPSRRKAQVLLQMAAAPQS